MVFFKFVSNATRSSCIQSFGNPSWSGTPFGSSSDYLIPVENKKQANDDKNKDVSFECEDDFKIL